MGGFTSLFGGSGGDAPDPIKYTPAPDRTTKDPEEKDVRDTERRRLRARANGVNGTLLSANKLGGAGSLGGAVR